MVNEHPDPMVRDPHVVQIADRCHVDPDHLRRFASGGPSMAPSDAGSDWDRTAAADRLTPEDEALQLAIHRPDEVAGRLHATLFGDPVRREAFKALSDEQTVAGASDRVSPQAARLLHRLAVDAGHVAVHDMLARVARLTASRAMNDLRRIAAAADDPALRQQCSLSVAWLKSQSERLDERTTRTQALAALLPWLIEHGLRSEGAAPGALVASRADPG